MPSTFDAYSESNEAVAARGVQPPVVAGTSPTQNSAPAKANAAANKTIVSGLVDALNKYQEELVTAGTYEYADTYVINLDSILESATVSPPGETNFKQTPMIQAKTAADAKLGAKQAVNTDAKSTKIAAGTSIVQFIDQLVRSSSYIYEQQIKIYDAKTGKLKDNGVPAQTIGWYRIGMEVEPKLDKYDRKRNDYAYTITYQVTAYAVNDVKSDFFPSPKFRGVQKEYNYWFTGKNTAILDFTQDYNYLYFIVSNGEAPIRTTTSDSIELEKAYFQPVSNETNKGQDDEKVNEPSANAADYLYSPGDQTKIKLKILGDPAWIFQSEVATGIQDLRTFNYGPFLTDDTINQEGQEILFQVAFNKPVDYDLDTGIADPTRKNYNRSATSAGEPRQRFIYKATECISTFSQGQFTQEIHGSMLRFPLPPVKKTEDVRETGAGAGTARAIDPNLQAVLDDNERANQPRQGLAQVIDARPKVNKPLATSSLAAEGFDNQALGLTEASAPTSGGQPVGPASSSAAVASLGGASGRGVGEPVTQQVFTNSGPVNVTSNAEIQQLYDQGRITPQERNQAAQGLAIRQRAANSPTTSQPVQRTKRDA
jgi:hypothetical protein